MSGDDKHTSPSFEELLSPEDEQLPPLGSPEAEGSVQNRLGSAGSWRDAAAEAEADQAAGMDNMMESVFLEGSPVEESIDLGGGSEDVTAATESPVSWEQGDQEDDKEYGCDLAEADLVEQIEKELNVTQEAPEAEAETPRADPEAGRANATGESGPNDLTSDITKYFQTSSSAEEFPHFGLEGDDSCAAKAAEEVEEEQVEDDSSACAEDDKPEADQFMEEQTSRAASDIQKTPPAHSQPRVTFKSQTSVHSVSSVCSDEAVPVSFEESKGQGIKVTPSTKSLTKYFSQENTEAVDKEGKSFFDTFTASEGDGALSMSPRPGLGFPASVRTRLESVGEGSDTLEPPTLSPLPSPFHANQESSVSDIHVPGPVGDTIQPSSQTPSFSESSLPPSLTPTPTPPTSAHAFGEGGEDPFTKGLNMSDIDRRYDAWIPSEATRQVLLSKVTSPATFVVQPHQVTMPGILFDEPLVSYINIWALFHKT